MGKRKSSKKSKQVATKKPLEWIQFGAKRNRVKIEVITDDCTNDEDCSMFSRNATKTDPNGNNASSTWMMDVDELTRMAEAKKNEWMVLVRSLHEADWIDNDFMEYQPEEDPQFVQKFEPIPMLAVTTATAQ